MFYSNYRFQDLIFRRPYLIVITIVFGSFFYVLTNALDSQLQPIEEGMQELTVMPIMVALEKVDPKQHNKFIKFYKKERRLREVMIEINSWVVLSLPQYIMRSSEQTLVNYYQAVHKQSKKYLKEDASGQNCYNYLSLEQLPKLSKQQHLNISNSMAVLLNGQQNQPPLRKLSAQQLQYIEERINLKLEKQFDKNDINHRIDNTWLKNNPKKVCQMAIAQQEALLALPPEYIAAYLRLKSSEPDAYAAAREEAQARKMQQRRKVAKKIIHRGWF